jgi:hypothetical protein
MRALVSRGLGMARCPTAMEKLDRGPANCSNAVPENSSDCQRIVERSGSDDDQAHRASAQALIPSHDLSYFRARSGTRKILIEILDDHVSAAFKPART